MTNARYTCAMKQRSQAVLEARRIFVIVLAIRVLLLAVGLVGLLLAKPAAIAGPLRAMAALVALGALALLPLKGRVCAWWLGLLLALDMLLMSTRVSPLALAGVIERAAWVREAAQVTLIEPFLFMVIPLVLLAWAYGRLGAWLGTLWGGLLQLGGTALIVRQLEGSPLLYADAIGRIVLMLALALIVAVLAERQRQQIDALQQAQARLRSHADTVEQLAVSRERNRLARDLHDTLAHSLAALTVQLQALRGALSHDPAVATGLADEAVSLARSGLQESRAAIQALRTDPLTALGLVGTIRGELRNLEARAGVNCELTVSGEAIDLTSAEELAALRICQEALRNIERHATASHVTVRLAYGHDRFDLTIDDDGQGFDPATLPADAERFGLAGMRERAELAGGELQVRSTPGQGTHIGLMMPRGAV